MAAFTTIALGLSAAVGIYGTVKAGQERREATRLQEQQQTLSTRRSRRQAIRQAQIQRANAVAAAGSLNALQGSSIAGGTSSLGSQLGSGLGFSTQMTGISRGISQASARAERFGTLGNLGFAAFRGLGGMPEFRNRLFPNGFNIGGNQRSSGLDVTVSR